MHNKFVYLQIAAALAVSAIAAWFSIVGLVAIFPGAATAIIAMGCALELAKIVTANTVFRKWKSLNRLFRTYFVGATLVLSMITSLGIFGYLSKAHIQHSVAVGTTADAVALSDNQISIVQQTIASDRQVLQQMDDAVTRLLNDTATVRRAVNLRSSQSRERKKLVAELDTLNTRLLTLQTDKTTKIQAERVANVDVGPLKYVASMVYGNNSESSTDRSARLLIGVLITVFDPLALLLLVSANKERQNEEPDTPEQLVIPNNVTPLNEPIVVDTRAEATVDVPQPHVEQLIGHHRLDKLAKQ